MSTSESTSDSPPDDTLSMPGRHRRRRLLATLGGRIGTVRPRCGAVSIDTLPLTESEWLETPTDEALLAWDG
jgi:hypothetical protein